MNPPLKLLQGGAQTDEEKSAAALLEDLPPLQADDLAVERVWRKLAAAPRPEPKRPLWLGAVGAAAMAAIALFVLLRPTTPPTVVAPDVVLASAQTTLLRLPGVSAMLVRNGNVQPVPSAHGTLLSLENGSVTARVSKRPAGEPFVIQAGDVTVKVVGTLFTVIRGQATTVSVREGIVEVTDAAGKQRQVVRGQSWSSASPDVLSSDATSDKLTDLLESGLKGESADQLRDRFEHLDEVAAPPIVPAPPPMVAPKPVMKAPLPAAPPAAVVPEPTAYDQAVALETQGDFAGAADALEIAVTKQPDRSDLLVKLGRLAMQRLDDPSRALAAFQRYRKQFPKGPLLEVVDFSVLEIRLAQGDNEASLKEMDHYLSAHPTSERVDEIHLRRGDLLRDQNDFGAALADYRTVRAPAQLDDAMFLQAVCEQRIGDAGGAANTLRSYLKRFPSGKHQAEARTALGDGGP